MFKVFTWIGLLILILIHMKSPLGICWSSLIQIEMYCNQRGGGKVAITELSNGAFEFF